MGESLRDLLVGTSALGVLFVIAVIVTLARPHWTADRTMRDRVLHHVLFGVALQCLHLVEEFITGFYVAFPRFLGLGPWSPEFFVSFNLAWIAIWLVSAVALHRGFRAALVPIWFFALGMAGNGIAHPLLALGTGGYFPGLVTSPAVGIVGAILLPGLFSATRREPNT